MDDVDRAYLDSFIPEGSIVIGMVTVVSFIPPGSDGALAWRVHNDIDAPLTSALGLLELAKLDLVARSNSGLPFSYQKDDDDGE